MTREAAQARGPTGAGADRRRLRGRDAEIDAIERLLNEVRTGSRAGVMTIVGDVGLGKSALLEHAIFAADGMRVLRCVGAPTEARSRSPACRRCSTDPRTHRACPTDNRAPVCSDCREAVEDRFLTSRSAS
jgi:hypothetical protein